MLLSYFETQWSVFFLHFSVNCLQVAMFQIMPAFPAGMQYPRDVPWRSPKGLNAQDLQGTFRRLWGDKTKKFMIWLKMYFLDAIVFVFHIYYCFYWNSKYSKVLNGEVHGTSTEPSCGTFRGPNDGTFWGHPRDVGHICFLNSTQKHIKLTLTVTQVNCGSEKFSEQYSNLNNKN